MWFLCPTSNKTTLLSLHQHKLWTSGWRVGLLEWHPWRLQTASPNYPRHDRPSLPDSRSLSADKGVWDLPHTRSWFWGITLSLGDHTPPQVDVNLIQQVLLHPCQLLHQSWAGFNKNIKMVVNDATLERIILCRKGILLSFDKHKVSTLVDSLWYTFAWKEHAPLSPLCDQTQNQTAQMVYSFDMSSETYHMWTLNKQLSKKKFEKKIAQAQQFS